MNMMKTAAIAICVIGVGIIITAFIAPPLQTQLALILGGLALAGIGVLLVKLAQSRQQDVERFGELTAKLEKLEKLGEKLENLEQPRNTGVAIADVISSGLKYYAEHLGQQKEEKDD